MGATDRSHRQRRTDERLRAPVLPAGGGVPATVRRRRQPMQFWSNAGDEPLGSFARCRLRAQRRADTRIGVPHAPDHAVGYRRGSLPSVRSAAAGFAYPPRTVLYRRDERLSQEGHTQRVVVDGDIRPLDGVIYHDDRKPLSRWLASQGRYAQAEADTCSVTHQPLSQPTKSV